MSENKSCKRLVIAISGASGAQLVIVFLKVMHDMTEWETHLIISKGAELTIEEETNYSLEEIGRLANEFYSVDNIGASIASGTYKTEGMVVIPCSMKTLAGIATGYADNLILRAADVTIKERRRLLLVTRESPLSPIHLKNMLYLAELGATILPPVMTFDNHPAGIEDMTRHIIGKVLSAFGLDLKGFKRWGEE